jgi:hypothetical protein
VTFMTPVVGLTGIRLEALEDPSLPGGNGPGLFPRNGNFVLSELVLVTAVPEPSALMLFAVGLGQRLTGQRLCGRALSPRHPNRTAHLA